MTFKVRKSKKIVTFLGAGASAAFGYPTTKPFLEKLALNVFGEERKYLNTLRNLYWVWDIEQVVEILDLLSEMESISKRSRLSSVFYKYPRIVDFGKTDEKHAFTPVFEGKVQWRHLIELTERLRDGIEDFTFEQYESDVSRYPKIRRVYEPFFSMVQEHKEDKQTFEVFTTNYDNVIENYCSQSGHTCKLSVLNHELRPIAKKVSKEKYILTKLHGSLNWLIDKQTSDIQVTETQSRVRKGSGRWARNEYVLFGTKARLGELGIYDKLFERLEKFLLEADVCIVVGFSFRDDHVKEKINQALQENKTLKILIVSRSPIAGSANNLVPKRRQLKKFRSQHRIVPLRCSFGTKRAISMTNRTLLEL